MPSIVLLLNVHHKHTSVTACVAMVTGREEENEEEKKGKNRS